VVPFHGVQQGEEGIMGILMISCPSTGRAVSTGIEMHRVDQLPTVIATVACSACGGVHEWTKRDAWLAEGGDHYRQAAAVKAADKANGRALSAV
jgi:hypothetical protein